MSKRIIETTPLESWIAQKIGIDMHLLSTDRIEAYQLMKLRETIALARKASPFYRRLLGGFTEEKIVCFSDLKRIPFTTANDLRDNGLQFLCVSQSEIQRVVTLDSSGTTGNPKRIYFTPYDQELTVDFFRQGMSTLVEGGDKVLILLPGERTGSVGDLLASALKQFGVTPVPHGVVLNIPETLDVILREDIDSVVGIPTQVLALARYADSVARIPLELKSVLLSTDYVPTAIIRELERLWGCEVFEHYGMTEMGLGGGVECGAHHGYHLREADLYFEIVNDAGESVPDGQPGEVVFTTLTGQGMPLIRYRTGDISRILTDRCGCGSILRRLDKIRRRKAGEVFVNGGGSFTIADLDEVLFSVDEVINYTASIDHTGNATKLDISASTIGLSNTSQHAIVSLLDAMPLIQRARSSGCLNVTVKAERCNGTLQHVRSKRTLNSMKEV